MAERYKVVIVGGGITGLCAAYYAMKEHGAAAVRLLEAAPYLGGTARTEHVDGYTLEMGPNGFLDKEPKTLQWVRDLGLKEQLLPADRAAARRFVFRGGTLHELKPPPAFFGSRLLSLQGRIRLLAEPLIPPRSANGEETVWDFAARRIGAEAADTLVAPMVSGIFGGDARHLHLASCFPKMAAMEAEHGGLFRALLARKKANGGGGGTAMGPGGTLTSFTGGMATLVDRAAEVLGTVVQTDTPVAEIARDPKGFTIRGRAGAHWHAESVLVAAPAHAAAPMVASLDGDLADALAAIPYAGMIVACTAFERKRVGHNLHGFGFLVPRTENRRILGCIWTSRLFPDRAPDDKILLRTMVGGATDPEAVNMDDDAVIALLREELFPILRIAGDPAFYRVYRWEKAIPQYTLGHPERVRRIEEAAARHPGLYFAGNAYRGVGLNDCVVSAWRALDRMQPEMAAPSES